MPLTVCARCRRKVPASRVKDTMHGRLCGPCRAKAANIARARARQTSPPNDGREARAVWAASDAFDARAYRVTLEEFGVAHESTLYKTDSALYSLFHMRWSARLRLHAIDVDFEALGISAPPSRHVAPSRRKMG